MDLKPADDETLDRFYHGRIRVLQRKRGYRFSVDAPLLADFIHPRADDEGLELGTGSGIIALLLSINPFRHITGLEVQPTLFELAAKNVRLNGLEGRITVLQQDLVSFSPSCTYDLIFANPPYHARGRGNLSGSIEKSVAKHELKCDIFAIMRKTAELLSPGGRACFIFPVARRAEFSAAATESELRLRRERTVRPRSGERPNLFLTEFGLSAEAPRIERPLVLLGKSGEYTREARQIFAGRQHVQASE
ncbi:MAG: tRNA1(Val) (adenine(37)-N6)-methyltransferase [Candidatus Aminicenantaceae bacterium]